MGSIFTIEVRTHILTNNKKSVWGKFRKNFNIISNNFIIVAVKVVCMKERDGGER